MTLIPKSIIKKLEKCHHYQYKSDDIMFELTNWFDEKGHSDDDGEFQATLNQIQGMGIETYYIERLEQYLKHER